MSWHDGKFELPLALALSSLDGLAALRISDTANRATKRFAGVEA